MKITIAGMRAVHVKNAAIKVKEKLETQYNNVVVEIMETLPIVLQMEADDLLVTFDLFGFERETLTGGVAYNLLNCKQIHILLNKKNPREERLAMPLSISMFFFCTEYDYYKYLMDTYPEIPYLQVMDAWNDENSAPILEEIITKVSSICRLPMKFRK